MTERLWLVGILAILCAFGPTARGDDRGGFSWSSRVRSDAGSVAPRLPLEYVPPPMRENIEAVLRRPSLSARGPSETFNADPNVYRWLLDHPDRTVKLWRLLGAKVTDIVDQGGVYVWRDDQGSEVRWHTALRAGGLHVWYAEGKVKPGVLLPLTSFRCVAIMQYTEGKDTTGKPAVKHQVHFLLRCNQGAMALAARILGASAPRLAEQYLGQLQMFYGGMAWYLGQDEARAQDMYRRIGLVATE